MLVTLVILSFVVGASMTSAQKCTELGDIAVVLDSSSQVDFETWDSMIRLIQELSYRFTISEKLSRVALVVYGNSAKLIFPFNRYFTSEEVAMAVGRLSYEPNMLANLTAALSFLSTSVFLEEHGARDNAPDAVLLVTASQPNVQREKVFSLASGLRHKGVRLFTVGIDGRVDRVELRAIATNPDEDHFYYTRGPKTLANLTNSIATNLCRDLQLCTDAADLVFILDCSGSVKEEWTRSLVFARNLVDLLPVGEFNVRVAAVAYSNYAHKQFDFDTDYTRPGIKALISDILYHDKNTNTSGGLRMTRERMFKMSPGDRPGVRDVGVLITDGKSTWEAENLQTESTKMHQAGIQMYAIGLGAQVDVNELKMIGSDPDIAHVFMVDQAEDQVTDAIRLKWSDCEIDTTYCSKYIDLVFVLDDSGSVGEGNFQRMLNFVRTLTGVLEIDAGTARVGLIMFGDKGKVLFHLNQYELDEEVARAILEVQYGRGTTNTADALNIVHSHMFTAENGDRPDVPNFVIVITDGASNNFRATLEESRMLKEKGITVLALGIGDPMWLRTAELRAMASIPRSKNMMQVTSFESLDSVVQAMQDATCNDTNECVESPCMNGGICNNGTNQYTCKCMENYAGKDCQLACPHFYDIVLAIDASGSVGETNFYLMLDFFTDLIGDLPFPGSPEMATRIGILTFSDGVVIEHHLNRYTDRRMIQDAIYTPYRQGTTNTAAAIRSIREDMFTEVNGDRPLVPNVAIIITDGKSTDREATWREAVKTREAGIHLVVIGVSNSVSRQELRGIATGPADSNIYRVPNFSSLQSIREPLVTSLCNAVNECDQNQCQNGASCYDGIGTYYCVCASGFVGQHCERRSSQAMDLVFLIDTSGSIQRENFPKLISFTKAIVNNLNVSSETVRVAAITFSSGAKLEFSLDEYKTKYDVMHALERIYYDPGTTNTAEALKVLRQSVFTGEGGDRLDVLNYAIIITDGDPDDLDVTVNEAVKCRIHGVRIVMVGIGTNGQRALEYRAIASQPIRKTLWSVRRVSQLPSLVDAVTDSIVDDRNYCVDVNCNAGTCKPLFLSYMCECPTPFSGKNCDRKCNRQMDLALVVDVSAEAKDFPLMLEFLRELILGVSFSYGNVRVSLVCFDKTVKTLFGLSEYTSSLEVLEAITLPKRGSGTDITSVLYTIRDEVFRPEKGDRTGVPNYVVLLSDGQSNGPPNIPDIPDISVFTVGIGSNVNRLVLNEISAHSKDSFEYQQIQSEKDVEPVLDMLLEHLCT